jgi:hypothetical protein
MKKSILFAGLLFTAAQFTGCSSDTSQPEEELSGRVAIAPAASTVTIGVSADTRGDGVLKDDNAFTGAREYFAMRINANYPANYTGIATGKAAKTSAGSKVLHFDTDPEY